MAFTVETGAGVAGANSYVSVADCDTYHADRGNAGWAGSNAVKQAALIKATDYVTQVYGGRWAGEKRVYNQDMDWPRVGTCDALYDLMVPSVLKQAVCNLALEALTDELNPVLDRGGMVKRRKTDVLETEYMDGAPSRTSRPAVDGLLKPILTSSGTSFMGRTVRV